MFSISNKSDYGLLVVSRLVDEKNYVPLSRIIEETKLPQRYIARIAADLVKNGILKSREGKIGGYQLAKKLDQITLLDFLKVFEEDINLVKCQKPHYTCSFQYACLHNVFFRKKLSGIVAETLGRLTLQDIIS